MIRGLIIEYVQQKYGSNAVSNIITFGTLAARAAIRNAGRVTGKPLDLCDKIAKMVPSKPGITIKQAMEENPDLKAEYESKKNVKELIDDALLLEGLTVQTGVHAAGVIIADRDISDYVPMIYDEDEKIWITQFDKDVCEADAGLLKMDFLGLENLNIISRTLDDIEKNHGVRINLDKINLDDKNVIREIFAKGRTKAVFQFESSGMVNLLKRFQPMNLEDLILLNAAYRPGPLQYLDEIIEIKHGRKKPSYICPKMEGLLSMTYSKPIYQEQIMSIFNQVAGFSLGVSDIIRRAMAKKKKKELKKYLPTFKTKLVEAGATLENAEKFCEELMDFSSYAFNKSHSAAYAVIAYWTAWLKYYYPVEYMANVLTSATTKKLPVYIKECKDMGIPVLPPSINESGRYFTPTKNKTIRFGLESIKNVGSACSDILSEREKNGEFKTLMNFIERLAPTSSRAVYKQVMECLIMTGAFDEFNLNRRQMMSGCVEYVKDLKDYLKKKDNPKLRPKTIEKALEKVNSPHFDITLPEYDKSYLLEQEKELIGFYASGHPLDEFQKVIDEKAEIMIGDIDEDKDGSYVTIVGQINSFQPLFRKSDGAAMGKFVIEDLTGEVNCICFTKAFKDCGDAIKEGSVVILKGRVMAEVERDPETNEVTSIDLQVSVNDVKPITSGQKVYVKLKNIYEWNKAKELLSMFTGRDELYVYFEDEQQVFKVKMGVKASRDLEEHFVNMFGEKKLAVI